MTRAPLSAVLNNAIGVVLAMYAVASFGVRLITPKLIEKFDEERVLAGAFVGSRLRRVLPSRHLEGETKAIVQTGIDLLAVLLCVTMGLLVDYINQSPDGTQKKEIKFEVYFNLLGIGSLGRKPYFMTL